MSIMERMVGYMLDQVCRFHENNQNVDTPRDSDEQNSGVGYKKHTRKRCISGQAVKTFD